MGWLLNITGINWYKDGEEYLLYIEETGDMLLFSELGYILVDWMQQYPKQVFSHKQLAKLIPEHLTDNDDNIFKNISDIIQNLLKMHLIKVVTS